MVNPEADVVLDEPQISEVQGLSLQWCIVTFVLKYVINCINCNHQKIS